MDLKKGVFYHFMIFTPLLMIILFSKNGTLSSQVAGMGILIYAIVYHPLISGIRLYLLGVIPKNEIWKMYLPFWSMRHVKELFRIY